MNTLRTNFVTLLCYLIIQSMIAQEVANADQIELLNHTKQMQLDTTREIIQSYVTDYKNDRFASDSRIVGIEINNHGSWTVHATGNKKDDGWEVILKEGLPKTPTYIYNIEFETLKAIDEGIINALTAQGKAFSGDYTPMSIRAMDGFQPTEADDGEMNEFSFHFWTRGFPEIIPFGEGTTRRAHGSNFTIFYYQKGIRTAWYRVLPEDKVRHDPREQAMPFPMLIVAIKGTTEGEVDGKPVSLKEGNTIFIPIGATHKWWNETKEASEAILIMFGEGA